LHINIDRFILEIVSPSGELCKEGELGEIVITDLDNYAFPMIRYKIGDLGVLKHVGCECGRGLPLLERIEGRVFDLVRGTNGNIVAGSYWTLLRNKLEGWDKFQIIQEEVGKLTILLEENKFIDSSFIENLEKLIKDKLGDDMIVEVRIMDSIPTTSSGKFRWVISKVSPYVS
jgi:phenylacetate-CoA ligase